MWLAQRASAVSWRCFCRCSWFNALCLPSLDLCGWRTLFLPLGVKVAVLLFVAAMLAHAGSGCARSSSTTCTASLHTPGACPCNFRLPPCSTWLAWYGGGHPVERQVIPKRPSMPSSGGAAASREQGPRARDAKRPRSRRGPPTFQPVHQRGKRLIPKRMFDAVIRRRRRARRPACGAATGPGQPEGGALFPKVFPTRSHTVSGRAASRRRWPMSRTTTGTGTV